MKKQIFALLAFSAFFQLTETANGQWKPWSQPTQKPLRLLGQGWSAGYHWRNPGHDSRYYNPYSPHNSYLISGQSTSQGSIYQYPLDQGPYDQNVKPNRSSFPALPIFEGEFIPSGEGPGFNQSSSERKNNPPLPTDTLPPPLNRVPKRVTKPESKSVVDEFPIEFD